MKDEEKEAIKIIKKYQRAVITELILVNAIDTVLNLVRKQEKEIDLMAEEILKIDTEKSKYEYDHAKMWDTEKGIKQYFESKVDKEK